VRHIGYYRLSPYAIPFREDEKSHNLREGTAFDEVLDLYVFDRALRLLVMDALERIEVAIRATLTDHMSTAYNDPHWYQDPSHFAHKGRHSALLKIIRDTSEGRLHGAPELGEGALVHRSALEHYVVTYGDPELPPSWLMVETLTIGQLSNVYRNLQSRADRTSIAKNLNLTAPVLESWLQTYVRVRNICAHHGRLWNVGLGVYPVIPTSRSIPWLTGEGAMAPGSTKRLYPVLVSLQSILDTVSPHSTWAERLHELVSTRPQMNLAGMGIPEHWAEDKFWSRHLA